MKEKQYSYFKQDYDDDPNDESIWWYVPTRQGEVMGVGHVVAVYKALKHYQTTSYGDDLSSTLLMFRSSPDSGSTLVAITHTLFLSDTDNPIANENSALQ